MDKATIAERLEDLAEELRSDVDDVSIWLRFDGSKVFLEFKNVKGKVVKGVSIPRAFYMGDDVPDITEGVPIRITFAEIE